jgi:hypothetical protein
MGSGSGSLRRLKALLSIGVFEFAEVAVVPYAGALGRAFRNPGVSSETDVAGSSPS